MSDINDLITKLFALAKRLEQKGVWIKRQYSSDLLTVFGMIEGEAKVMEITALTDKADEGIEWKAEFPNALKACVKALGK